MTDLKHRIETAEGFTEGGEPIETAPKDGTWVRVRHELGTYGTGETIGRWSGSEWQCSEFFIDPHSMRMYRQPTHWRTLMSAIQSSEKEGAR
jgi:hypothetical protein